MEAPFERTGPGQVARLAYQVIGQNGPIFNPNNIRYIPAGPEGAGALGIDPSTISGTGTESLAPALAGINLLASVGALAISTANYVQCRKILKAVNRIQIEVSETKALVEDIQKRVERIDMRVAENNLREAMKHAFKEALTEAEIHLDALHCLVGDFENFADSLESPLIFNFGIRLASDVRKDMMSLYLLLGNLRMLVANEHNLAWSGHPQHSITFDPYNNYYSIPLVDTCYSAFYFGASDNRFFQFVDGLTDKIGAKFFFSSDDDKKEFLEFAKTDLIQPIWENRRTNPSLREAEILCDVVGSLGVDFTNREESPAEIYELVKAWNDNSDAALVHKTSMELRALKSGFKDVFYPYLPEVADEKVDSNSTTYTYQCDLDEDLMAAAQ